MKCFSRFAANYRTLLLILLLFSSFPLFGQKVDTTIFKLNRFNQFSGNGRPAKQPEFIPTATANRNAQRTQRCLTSNFMIRLKQPAGQRIELSEVQSRADGTYILAGTLTNASNEKEGYLALLSNDGDIISQQKLRIGQTQLALTDIQLMLDGTIVFGGIAYDPIQKPFVGLLNPDLSTRWLKTLDAPAPILNKVSLSLIEENIGFAVSSANSVTCALLTTTGDTRWIKTYTPPGMVSLVGFSRLLSDTLGLVTNTVNGGRKQVHITSINGTSGAAGNSHHYGNLGQQSVCGEVNAFNGRLVIAGIKEQLPGQFNFFRTISYSSSTAETEDVYNIPVGTNLTATTAMDNAGDVMGICAPAEGKLVFLNHFASYQVSLTHAKSYDIPIGSSIAAVSRSFIDGGYLFGLNAAASNEILLIKTDSIGILGQCGSKTLEITFNETFGVKNSLALATSSNAFKDALNIPINFSEASLSKLTDCNTRLCPPPPEVDTCQSTYLKALRSNSFADGFNDHILLRKNQQITSTIRYDRILGNSNQLTYGIKLFDEGARFIKGVNVFLDGISTGINIHKTDSSHFIMIQYGSSEDLPAYTFTKMDDDLQVIWSKTLLIPPTLGFSRSIYDDFITDSSGNHYMIGSSPGFLGPPLVHVYKMNSNGDPLWLKSYSGTSGYFLMGAATATNTSIIVVEEGSVRNGGSFSLEIDQATGAFKNGYRYANGGAGIVYRRELTFHGHQVYYAGNDDSENFIMATFDSTARPTRLKRINNSSTTRAATVDDHHLFATFNYYNGTSYKNVFLKADSTLALDFMKEQDPILWGYPVGMSVGDNKHIYLGGNASVDGYSAWDPYVTKLDPSGSLGTCPFTPSPLQVSDVELNTVSAAFTVIDHTVKQGMRTVSVVPDDYGQAVGAILCSSTSLCTSIEVTGPEKVCRVDETYTYKSGANPGCTLSPAWTFDTAYVQAVNSSIDSISLRFKKPGMTWVVAVLNTGCVQYTDSLQVTIQSNPALISLGEDKVICPGKSLQLEASEGFNSYVWQDGSTSREFSVTQPGKYFIRAENICGDVARDTIDITAAHVPIISLGDYTEICFRDTLHLDAGAGFTSYSWKSQAPLPGNARSINRIATNDESISIDAVTTEGCHAYDTLQVRVLYPRSLNLGTDTSFCAGNSIMLTAPNDFSYYIWNTGTTVNTLNVEQAGAYWLHAKDINGCMAKDTLIVFAVYPMPSFTLGPDFDLCEKESKIIRPGNFVSYLWQDNSTSPQFNIIAPGKYWVTVKNNHGCEASDTLSVKKILPVPRNFLKTADSICQYELVILSPTNSYSQHQWSNGATQSSISVQLPGKYVLTVVDENGCSGADSITVFQKNCTTGVYIPTAFSPNEDNLNDVFRARVYGITTAFTMRVYNRWGELLFETTDPTRGWDGKIRGVPADPGVFVWQCHFQQQGAAPEYRKGLLTLVR